MNELYCLKNVLIFLVLLLYRCTVGFTTTDDCDSEDAYCQMTNVFGLGDMFWDKCVTTGVVRRIGEISLLGCVTECLLTTKCFSISYRQQWRVCDLNEEQFWKDGSVPHLYSEDNCIHSDMSSWAKTVQKSLTRQCYNHNCIEGHKCHYTPEKGVHCHLAYCRSKPNIPIGIIQEQFGLHRNIGSGVWYECPTDLVREGMPFVVCRNKGNGYGEWDLMFTCVQANCPIDYGYRFNEDLSLCYKLYPIDSDREYAKETCKLDYGELMKIDTWEKQSFIGEYLATSRAGKTYMLIQGTRQLRNGDYSWRYDNGTELTYFNWAPMQPEQGGQFICLATADGYQWHACHENTSPSQILCEIRTKKPNQDSESWNI